MLPPADRIVEATLEHTLRPKRHNREKVIAAVLEFVIEEYSYVHYNNHCDYYEVIDVKDLQQLIKELRDTVNLDPVTLEEPSQGHRRKDLDAL